MRINRVQLAGLALALFGVTASEEASAADVTISTATTTPVTTALADGTSPGNVTVASGGTVTITTGQAGLTLNSNNTITNSGIVASTDANNTIGIRILGGFTGTVTNNGSINMLETYAQTDTDSDGDLDGAFAMGTDRHGIWLQSGSFTGDITSTTGSVIGIKGNNSDAIRIDGNLVGNLLSNASIAVLGNNSTGVAISGGAANGVTGNVTLGGSINVRGLNDIAVLVDAPIGGALNIVSAITATGYSTNIRPVDATAAAKLDADDKQQGGPAVAIQASVAGGVTIRGIGVEDDIDDDGDGITEAGGDTDDDASASIASFGAAPGILIRPNATTPTNIVLGATASGFGFDNRGAVAGNGVFDGVEANGLRIEGAGGATVTTANGVLNDGSISALAFEANSNAVVIGTGVTVPTFENRGLITGASTSETARNANGVQIASGAVLPALINTGSITAKVFGEIGAATAIVDHSNSLATITNSGSIIAQVIATDSDASDNITPVATGAQTAIDVSGSTIGVTLNQIADTPFTDDDTVDDDVATRPAVQIFGSVLFGSGNDTFNLLAGQSLGDVSFGAGADTLTIDNGASLIGRVGDSDGALTINVVHGNLDLTGGATNITSAHFGATSTLGVLLSQTVSDSTKITSSGGITFDAGAVIQPVVPSGIPNSGSLIFLTANGGLTGAANVTRILTGADVPFIYHLAIETAPGDPNSLQATFALKTPVELGLSANETNAFNPVLAALRQDSTASAAFTSIDNSGDLHKTISRLLPNYSSAAAELAATAIQQGQSASGNRLASMRLRDDHEVSAWAQEIAYGLSRDPDNFGLEYNGYGFGFATGIDGPLRNGQLFGLSASFISSEITQPGRRDGELSASFVQANAYLGSSLGPVDLDLLAGGGLGKMHSRRFADIGTSFRAVATGDWWAYEGHATARVSAPMRMAEWMVLRPQVALTYVVMQENAYKESGGGAAIDLDLDSATSQRLWGDIGVRFDGHFGHLGQTIVAPYLSLGYRANLIDEAAERTLRFASGGSSFTLTDEALGSGAPIVGIGVDASNGFSTVSVSYEGEFGDQVQRNSLNATVRFRF